MLTTFDAGVDWVTTTVDKQSPDFEKAWALYVETFEKELREGHQPRPWRFLQFSGYIAGSVRVGQSEHDAICMVSSGPAHQFAIRLGETIEEPRISRIDYQMTGKTPEDVDKYIRKTFFEVDGKGRRGANNREYGLDFLQRPRTGKTLEFGSRRADRFGKLYNKTREQKGRVEAGLFRYEFEGKRDQANRLFRMWRKANYSRVWIADFVATWFAERGVEMDWVDRENAISCPSSYVRTSLEKKMDWVSKFWAKTAKEICDEGHAQWMLAALGFGAHAVIHEVPQPEPMDSLRDTPPMPNNGDEIDYVLFDRWNAWLK